MKFVLALFSLLSIQYLFAQIDIAGYYHLESMSGSCDLNLKIDSSYTLYCSQHMSRPKNFTGQWKIRKDTLILFKDDSVEKILITSNLLLNNHFGKETTKDGYLIAYHPSYYKKVKSYYKNGRLQYKGNWRRNFGWEPQKQGFWEYYNIYGKLSKLEKYNKGKLKKTITDTYKMYQILNRLNERELEK